MFESEEDLAVIFFTNEAQASIAENCEPLTLNSLVSLDLCSEDFQAKRYIVAGYGMRGQYRTQDEEGQPLETGLVFPLASKENPLHIWLRLKPRRDNNLKVFVGTVLINMHCFREYAVPEDLQEIKSKLEESLKDGAHIDHDDLGTYLEYLREIVETETANSEGDDYLNSLKEELNSLNIQAMDCDTVKVLVGHISEKDLMPGDGIIMPGDSGGVVYDQETRKAVGIVSSGGFHTAEDDTIFPFNPFKTTQSFTFISPELQEWIREQIP